MAPDDRRPGEWSSTGAIPSQRADTVSRPVQSSLLDRLTDEEPGNSHEVMPTRAESVIALRIAVRHDLEWLLNTRRDLVAIDSSARGRRRSLRGQRRARALEQRAASLPALRASPDQSQAHGHLARVHQRTRTDRATFGSVSLEGGRLGRVAGPQRLCA